VLTTQLIYEGGQRRISSVGRDAHIAPPPDTQPPQSSDSASPVIAGLTRNLRTRGQKKEEARGRKSRHRRGELCSPSPGVHPPQSPQPTTAAASDSLALPLLEGRGAPQPLPKQGAAPSPRRRRRRAALPTTMGPRF